MLKLLSGLNSQLVQSLIFWNCWALVFATVLYTLMKNQKRISANIQLPANLPLFVLMVCYVVSVASITIVPLPFSEQYNPVHINLKPIINTAKQLLDPIKRQNQLLAIDIVWNIAGNVIMFVPFGFFIPYVFPKTNRYRYVALSACVISSCIELGQLFSRLAGNYRQVDIDDVILNVCGGMLGYYIYRKTVTRKLKAPWKPL